MRFKRIISFLVLGLFFVFAAMLPEIFGDDVKALAKGYLGENYQYILLIFFSLLFLLAAYFNPEIGMGLFQKTLNVKAAYSNIPGTLENRKLLQDAKKALQEDEPNNSLEIISKLSLKNLEIEISELKSRLAQLQRNQRQGTQSSSKETRELNRIRRDILSLITTLEQGLNETLAYYDKIRVYLKQRYENRLAQKLSRRQPINLRLVPSTKGTSPEAAATFVHYTEGEARKKLVEYFEDAQGRLLLVGVPGVGKTTSLLQLALQLMDKEIGHLPVILNLARWNKDFPNLESWIQEVLPSEMGLMINKKDAAKIAAQNRLILLLDGFDEVKAEDRQTCLDGIGAYGEDSNRRFIISSRIDEYQLVQKDAPVSSQVEIGTLNYEQLVQQLEIANQNDGAKRLLAALKEDELIREVAETPFYFNILQLLFARGKFLKDFNFIANDSSGRKKEIEAYFVQEMIKRLASKKYDSQQILFFISFLASRLDRENIVDMELIHMKYSWVKPSRLELLVGSFIESFVRGIPLGLSSGLVFATINALEGFMIGLLNGQIGDAFGKQRLVDIAQNFAQGFAWGTVIMLSIGVLFTFLKNRYPVISTVAPFAVKWDTIITYVKRRLSLVIVGGLIFGPICSLIIVYFMKLDFSLGKSLLLGLIIGPIYGMVIFYTPLFDFYFKTSQGVIIQVNTPYKRFIDSTKVGFFSILQHWHLRYLMSKKRLLPFKLVRFLNQLVECYILETDGASWRFRHKILQDYFSAPWKVPKSNTEDQAQ